MERLYQSETHYPEYLEGHSGVTGAGFGICRLTDGFWWDFNDSTFKDAGWTTQYQAMAEDTNGLWIYTTGWAIPDANAVYKSIFEVTDATGTFYSEGVKIVVNDAVIFDVVAAIKVITDALTAAAAAKLALSAGTIVSGAATVTTLTTTTMSTNLSEVTDDHYNGRIIIWTSGVLQNQATDITDYTGSTKLLTFTAVTEAPGNTDTFIIV